MREDTTNAVPEVLSAERIIVFVGPSIPLRDALRLLPGARYLPPARCGDVLRVLRLRPQAILVIDGYFERTAAIWHKEVLIALERGVLVFGAASMGALRAAELREFGMQGIGEIFGAFARGRLHDDDEVAVVHDGDYWVRNNAMVNLRATFQAALQRGIISGSTVGCLTDSAKQIFYPERRLKAAVQLARQRGAHPADLDAFLHYVEAYGCVDQKRMDAEQALQMLALKVGTPVTPHAHLCAERTAGVRALFRSVMCRPFPVASTWLPWDEQVLAAARFLGPCYCDVRRVAELLHVLSSLEPEQALEQWMASTAHTCSEQTLSMLVDVLLLLSDEPSDREGPPVPVLRERIRTEQPRRHELLRFSARLLWVLETEAQRLGLTPAPGEVQAACDRVRYDRGLTSRTDMARWLEEQQWSPQDLQRRLTIAARYYRLVQRNLLDALTPRVASEHTLWLLSAFHITGFYRTAQELLQTPKQSCLVEVATDAEAEARDFTDGHAGYLRERAKLLREEGSVQ